MSPPTEAEKSLVAPPLAQRFPTGFVWGTATASYQIEGGVTADGRGQSIWDSFTHSPGKVRDGDTGDVADDHYPRWQDDVGLMGELGVNAYRFSVAWPHIFPDGRGAVNEAGLGWYCHALRSAARRDHRLEYRFPASGDSGRIHRSAPVL